MKPKLQIAALCLLALGGLGGTLRAACSPASMTLNILGDDGYRVYLNGQLIIDRMPASPPGVDPQYYKLPQLYTRTLTPGADPGIFAALNPGGDNVLAVYVSDGYGSVSGVSWSFNIDYGGCCTNQMLMSNSQDCVRTRYAGTWGTAVLPPNWNNPLPAYDDSTGWFTPYSSASLAAGWDAHPLGAEWIWYTNNYQVPQVGDGALFRQHFVYCNGTCPFTPQATPAPPSPTNTPTITPTFTPAPCGNAVQDFYAQDEGALAAQNTWPSYGTMPGLACCASGSKVENPFCGDCSIGSVNGSAPPAFDQNTNREMRFWPNGQRWWDIPDVVSAPASLPAQVVLHVVWAGSNPVNNTNTMEIDYSVSSGPISPVLGASGLVVNNSALPVSPPAPSPGASAWIDSAIVLSPPGGWDWAKFNNLKIFVRNNHASQRSFVDAVWVEVTWPQVCTATPTYTVPGNSPTFSFSPTITATRTPTPTLTSTPTLTATPTTTPTSTVTATPSDTPTLSSTPTVTATPTSSPSFTPSQTFTATRTATPSPTPSPTFSATSTSTVTPTPSPTATVTDSFSATDTLTSTATFSDSPTQTLTRTPSPTATDTRTATASFTDSPTRTDSPTITDTPTITMTRTPGAPFRATVRVFNSAGELVADLTQAGQLSLYVKPASIQNLSPVALPDSNIPARFELLNGGDLISWDGTNNASQRVSTGIYSVVIQVTDPFGKVESLTALANVIRQPSPGASVVVYNSAGEALRHLSLSLGPGADPTQLRLGDSKLVSGSTTVQVSVDGGGSAIWDGRNDEGRLVAAGDYMLRLESFDAQGGRKDASASVTVLRDADHSTFTAIAAPNPASTKDSGVHVAVSAPPLWTISATAYNTAGEAVAQLQTEPQGLFWDLSRRGYAGGFYLLVVQGQGPGGESKRLTLKVALR